MKSVAVRSWPRIERNCESSSLLTRPSRWTISLKLSPRRSPSRRANSACDAVSIRSDKSQASILIEAWSVVESFGDVASTNLIVHIVGGGLLMRDVEVSVILACVCTWIKPAIGTLETTDSRNTVPGE